MSVWCGRPRPRALIPGLAVVVLFQFHRVVPVILVVVLFMAVIMVMFLSVTLLFPEDFTRQFFFTVDIDVQLCGRDPAAIHSRNFQPGSNIKRRDRVLEQLSRNSGIYQGAEKHVAADAGEAVEVSDAHRSQLIVVGLWSWVVGKTYICYLSEDAIRRRYKKTLPQPPTTSRQRPAANDQRPMTNDRFHHREACIPRQTSRPLTVCYNHFFLQQFRGDLVSPIRTPSGPVCQRLHPPHLRSRAAENRGRAATQSGVWGVRFATGL